MAKQETTTTKTTLNSKKNPVTTTTTTTRTIPNKRRKQTPAPAPKKKGHGAAIVGVIIILILLGALAYYLLNPPLTLPQQQSQFAGQLSMLQNNNQNLSAFYLANAPNYNIPVNKSWSVQITDKGAQNVTIGQLTISWYGKTKNLSILNGIVNTGISPTYAVTLPHSEFMSFTQAAITRNTAEALADYSAYYLTGKLNYTRIR
jgi:predicted PurR-regulated permease PerM